MRSIGNSIWCADADPGDTVKTNIPATATCLVSAEDYHVYWQGGTAPELKPIVQYEGPERRQNQHDRRWLATSGGRRRFDRKS